MNDDDILYFIIMLLGYILRIIFWIFTFQWLMGMFSSRSSSYRDDYNEDYNQQGYESSNSFESAKEEDKAYKILGVNQNCTADELKASYRTLAKKYHPDRSKDPKAGEKMAEINKAYDYILAQRGVKH